jgi:LmbE family N-acetylglucosaminyl deacetylase
MDENKKVLLAVLAHPDDESFGMGGTLAYYASKGVDVYLVCATRGEVGDVDPKYLEGFHSIAERREAELRCAAGILDLAGVTFLNYRDSGMPGSPDNQHPKALVAAPLSEVAKRVATQIRRYHPQVVVTFDPIGGYKHPDHIAIQRATTQAFSLAGDPTYEDGQPPYQPQKLYYHVIPKNFLSMGVNLLKLFGRDPHHFGRNRDIDLAELVDEGDFPVNAEIDIRSVREKKDAAGACHASQLEGGPPRRGLVTWLLHFWDSKEQYMRAQPEALKGRKERDLFAGVQ